MIPVVRPKDDRESRGAAPPEIDVTANVRMREITYEVAPEVRVDFTGEPDHESASGSDRDNLPELVEEGVVYRDASVQYRIVSRLAYDDSAD